jgi:hypothetical protein
MGITVNDLIGSVPAEVEATVRRTCTDLKEKIQRALRQESRLLRKPQGQAGKDTGQEYVEVPVIVKLGVPECLRRFQLPVADPLVALIAPYRLVIGQAREKLGSIEHLVAALRSHPEGETLLEQRDWHIPPVIALLDDLLRKGSGIDLVQLILGINRDVLGAYIYDGPVTVVGREEKIPRIEIYWQVIGLVAKELGVEVEDLTTVVLAHEQAHAYTHLGIDADDQSWGTDGFAKSDIGLVEGLAQYYTEQIVGRLAKGHPGARPAYERLLDKQPPDYQTHRRWIHESTPEAIRIAMIEERRRGTGKLERFAESLRFGNERLRNSPFL